MALEVSKFIHSFKTYHSEDIFYTKWKTKEIRYIIYFFIAIYIRFTDFEFDVGITICIRLTDFKFIVYIGIYM